MILVSIQKMCFVLIGHMDFMLITNESQMEKWQKREKQHTRDIESLSSQYSEQ